MTHPQQTTREVIEQCVQALNHCMDAITERGLNGSPDQAEKWGLQLPLERAYAALAAGQQALEQTQVGKPSIELPTIHEVEYQRVRGEAQKLAVSLWTKHYRDDAPQWTVLSDTLGALSQISNMVAGMVRPQATGPAPSTTGERATYTPPKIIDPDAPHPCFN